MNAVLPLHIEYARFSHDWAALWEDGASSEKAARRNMLIARKERLCRTDEADLVAALRQEGFQGESVWDLVNSKNSYPHLHKVLIDHVGRNHLAPTREGLYRALIDARGDDRAFDVLVEQWRQGAERSDDGNRWALALAISLIAKGKKQTETLAELDDGSKAAEPIARRIKKRQGKDVPPSLDKVTHQ